REAIPSRDRFLKLPYPTSGRDVSLRIEIVRQHPASPPAPIAEDIDIPLLGDEELQEADALVDARLLDAQQGQVTRQAGFRQQAVGDLPVIRESLDSVLRVVVVPGHAVVIQEGEELAPVLLEPLLVALGGIGAIRPGQDRLEEPSRICLMLAEMSPAQAVPIDRRHGLPEQPAELGGEAGLTHQPGASGGSRKECSATVVEPVWPGIGCLLYHRTPG